jgi:hypothetical protein
MSLRKFMEGATSGEAQLALSYLIWPDEAPDPRLVDEWISRHERARAVPHSCPKRPQTPWIGLRMNTRPEVPQSL